MLSMCFKLEIEHSGWVLDQIRSSRLVKIQQEWVFFSMQDTRKRLRIKKTLFLKKFLNVQWLPGYYFISRLKRPRPDNILSHKRTFRVVTDCLTQMSWHLWSSWLGTWHLWPDPSVKVPCVKLDSPAKTDALNLFALKKLIPGSFDAKQGVYQWSVMTRALGGKTDNGVVQPEAAAPQNRCSICLKWDPSASLYAPRAPGKFGDNLLFKSCLGWLE